MFSLRSTSIKATLALLFLGAASAAAQIQPNQIDWPTGASGCLYAPGSNTCIAPSYVIGSTVSALPAASSAANEFWGIYDGASATDCTAGSGTTFVWCASNGSAWSAVGGSGGTVSDGSGTTTAGLIAQSTAVAHVLTYAPNAGCPIITSKPYNCACDGSTDDSACIQAAMDANSCIQLPISTPASQQQCNVGTGLVQNNLTLRIYGNGGILAYTGTGTELSASSAVGNGAGSTFVDSLYFQLLSPTGTPTEIDAGNMEQLFLNNVLDDNGPTGYFSLANLEYTTHMVESYLDGLVTFGGTGSSLTGIDSSLNGPVTVPTNTFIGGIDTSFDGSWDFSAGHSSLNGFGGLPTLIGAPASGTYCQAPIGPCVTWGLTVAGTIYSHAGTQLAACVSYRIGTAWVSDASALVPGTAYDPAAGAGTDTVQVQCTYDGATYAWKTM